MKNNIGFSRFGNLFAYLENILDRGVNFGVYTVFTRENIIIKNRFFCWNKGQQIFLLLEWNILIIECNVYYI